MILEKIDFQRDEYLIEVTNFLFHRVVELTNEDALFQKPLLVYESVKENIIQYRVRVIFPNIPLSIVYLVNCTNNLGFRARSLEVIEPEA